METSTFIASPKVKVSIVKAVKGYRWAVEVTDENARAALEELTIAEEALKEKYGSKE